MKARHSAAEPQPKHYLTAETPVVRKNPFMLREPQHERDGIIDNSSTYPLVLSVSKGERRFFLMTAEFTEIGVLLDQELFTLRPQRLGLENCG